MAGRQSAAEPGRCVVVIGAGNIASHLLGHLARTPELAQVTIIDPGEYGPENLATQDIERKDVGRRKAHVQARRLRRIHPNLIVEPIVAPVERVPLGRLRSAVVLAGVDNNRARQTINERALHLGIPWIDAGVEADALLARVNVYVPGPDRACLECAWSDSDYERLDLVRPCSPEIDAPPTNAPSSLGALAAAIQAIECRKVLNRQWDELAIGQQILLDSAHHKHYVTRFPRNESCRLVEHEPWTIEPLGDGAPRARLERVVNRAASDRLTLDGLVLRVPGELFVRETICRNCRETRPFLRIERALSRRDRRCRCGGERLALQVTDALDAALLSPRDRSTTLQALGMRIGDVIRVDAPERAPRHFEITRSGCDGDPSPAAKPVKEGRFLESAA
jgi:molybdopterin/thiamine biosynthesis adenylyltransferase